MERKLIITEDGSHSIAIPGLNVTYHSIHGAVQESKHVFVEAGLKYVLNDLASHQLNIFEMGFGTGLNALLTAIEAEEKRVKICYTAIERYPLSIEESKGLNYSKFFEQEKLFENLHESAWGNDVSISKHFTLRKENIDLVNCSLSGWFDLIYYDAFAPAAQPELWTKEIFQKLFELLKPNGVLVTYCSKGDVRRAMIAAGFTVTKLPGPPGKREILRAMKF